MLFVGGCRGERRSSALALPLYIWYVFRSPKHNLTIKDRDDFRSCFNPVTNVTHHLQLGSVSITQTDHWANSPVAISRLEDRGILRLPP